MLFILAFLAIGLDLIAVLAAAFPGSSGEWSGLGIAIPATLAAMLGLLMAPLLLTQTKGQRRTPALLTALVFILPLLAMGVARGRNYLQERFGYRAMPIPTKPLPAPTPAAAPAPRQTLGCIAERDPAYALSSAAQRVIDLRDRRPHWENRLAQDQQLRARHPEGYDQMLAEAFAQYRAQGGQADDVAQVQLPLPPCGNTPISLPSPNLVLPPERMPQRPITAPPPAIRDIRTLPNRPSATP
ncbi:MAG TPA: hypothetical protein VI279_15505 [Rhodocyclaceae bacterium]